MRDVNTILYSLLLGRTSLTLLNNVQHQLQKNVQLLKSFESYLPDATVSPLLLTAACGVT
jgi:hypothetical protein